MAGAMQSCLLVEQLRRQVQDFELTNSSLLALSIPDDNTQEVHAMIIKGTFTGLCYNHSLWFIPRENYENFILYMLEVLYHIP